jgi:hypothetical protein
MILCVAMVDPKDGPKKNKKSQTTPGFGQSDPLPPLQVARVPITVDDEPAAPKPLLGMEPAPPSGMADIGHLAPLVMSGSPKRVSTPAVDIDLVYEKRSAPLPDAPWTFLEIWTRNTIYALDARLHCVDVIDQATKKSLLDHPLRGARLVGGQIREGDAMELSHPFPRPGSEAVFEQAQGRHVRFSQTSGVTRVVMRLRVLTVTPDQLLPTWEEVTGTHSAESIRGKK